MTRTVFRFRPFCIQRLAPRGTFALAGVFLCVSAPAADLSEIGKREVAELLARVEQSGCEFGRAGSWYTGLQARAHLQKKYDYLLSRQELASTEDFVDKAATRSSMTGAAYTMRCAGASASPSAVWLVAELTRMRVAAGSASAQAPR